MGSFKPLKQQLSEGQVFAPCTWGCFSALAAEKTGFQATILSGASLSIDICGLPDIGLITADDLVRGTEALTRYTEMPVIVDADDGYGETPLHAYRLAKRLQLVGAQGMSVDDTTGVRGFERFFYRMRNQEKKIEHPVVDREVWLAKVKAAVDATAGTGFLVIARTEAKMQYGIEEAIERCRLAHEIGAEMTMIIGITTEEDAEIVSKSVPGWKMWPDVMSRNGKPDVELDKLNELGFNLVTCHVFEKAALAGMIDFGIHTMEERNTVYHDTFRPQLISPEFCQAQVEPLMHWLDEEAFYNDCAKKVIQAHKAF
ncbi:MAG: isocitrate lyase/PEP mutase family protein [Bacillota bacterium]|nr:isocitrate lyase/PEP mutase family protein [Bacillota bacterium]